MRGRGAHRGRVMQIADRTICWQGSSRTGAVDRGIRRPSDRAAHFRPGSRCPVNHNRAGDDAGADRARRRCPARGRGGAGCCATAGSGGTAFPGSTQDLRRAVRHRCGRNRDGPVEEDFASCSLDIAWYMSKPTKLRNLYVM
nr:hypothetical protein GCM10025699_17080 [Microbacterium flavescens]